MRGILVAGGAALAVSILLTPYLIQYFARRGFGQEISAEGPAIHQSRRGTPTMGGVAILVSIWVGYLLAHLIADKGAGGPTASAWLVLLVTTLMGAVGFLDDLIKLRRRRNLGLNKTSKLAGRLVTAVVFAVLALRFANDTALTPASVHLSFVRDLPLISLGSVGFVLFTYLVISAWSNAASLTDGLDGLAGGGAAMALGAYVVIGYWQFRHLCLPMQAVVGCYSLRDPLDVTLVAAAAVGGCVGFLWWNAAPARIILGGTGSLALGGLLAGLSIVTHTELLLVVICGVFVVEALSVALQTVVFRISGRRLFRMAPFHHHFELAGWAETTVIIRFWLLAGICAAIGLGIVYSDWWNSASGG